jgi:SAM-dependent methyltransferase
MSVELPPLGGSPLGSSLPLARAPFAPELLALPAPRHLHEALTRSQHLHFGYFETPADSLPQAQDRLITRALRHLPRAALVADVGCGLGGAVNLIAAQGHRVYGLDPCVASIAYARTRTSSPRAQLLVADLAQFATRAKGARFDALFLTEVLVHFPDLAQLFAHCRALLRPGGMVIIHDLARVTRVGPGSHGRGALRMAADAAGFDMLEGRDVSHRVVSTLPRLARGLVDQKEVLGAQLAPARTDFERECLDYLQQLRNLELAFARQEVAYEVHVLRCSTRFSTDSVVMRAPTRSAAAPSSPPRAAGPALARAEHLPRID